MISRLAVLSLCLLLSPTAAQENSFEAAHQSGWKSYYAREFDDALVHFANARALAPNRWEGHAGQALTIIHQALMERDGRRRIALTREAEAMTVELVKKSGLMFQHPLRNYILGLCATARGEVKRAADILQRAHSAPQSMFLAFESIDLRGHVSRAYGRALMDLGKRFIILGQWNTATPILERATRVLPKDDGGWNELMRSMAVLDEAHKRWESAIQRLHKCIEMEKRPQLKLEFRGTIAQIYFKNQRFEDGRKILAEVPEDSTNPEIVAARCTARMHAALRGSARDERIDKALAYYRKALETFPKDDRHRLVEQYTQIVLSKVGVREAQQERALLEDAVRRMLIEMKVRPECPSIYFLLYKLYKLLGNVEKENEFEALHRKKRAEFEGKARFDTRGRPRCR